MKVMIEIPDNFDWAVAAARLNYNASQPATIAQMQDQQQEIPPAIEGDAPTFVTRRVTVQVPNPDLIAADGDYLGFVISRAVSSWAVQHRDVAPVPDPETVVVNNVPQEVSMRQAQEEMLYTPTVLSRNPPLLDVVQQAIDAMGDTLDERAAKLAWAKSSMVQRNHPLITELKPLIMNALALADDQAYSDRVDLLFQNAAKRVI